MSLGIKLTTQKQKLIQELDLILRSRSTLLYMLTAEEEPVESLLKILAKYSQPPRQILTWNIARGWQDNQADSNNIMGALNRIVKTPEASNTIFVFKDLHFVFKNPHDARYAPIIREIKNLAQALKTSRKTIIFTSHFLH